MLLRVPAASLAELAAFSNKLKPWGHTPYTVATRISFDRNEAYPKFQFSAVRELTDEEAEKVVALREDERVGRILNEAVEHAEAQVLEPVKDESIFEQPPAPKPTSAPAAKPVAAPKAAPAPRKAPAAAPAAQTSVGAAQNAAPVVDAEYTEVQAPAKETPPVKAKTNGSTPPKPVQAAPVEADEGNAPESFDDLLEGLLDTPEG
jgi:hypothetical protein